MHEAAARALQYYEDMPYRLPDRPRAGSDRVRLRSEPTFEHATAAIQREAAVAPEPGPAEPARAQLHQRRPDHPPRRPGSRPELRLIEAEAHPRRADRIATAPMAEVRTIRLEAEQQQQRPKRRRESRPAPGLIGRPDRIAMWAVMLGFFLTGVAAATGHA